MRLQAVTCFFIVLGPTLMLSEERQSLFVNTIGSQHQFVVTQQHSSKP